MDGNGIEAFGLTGTDIEIQNSGRITTVGQLAVGTARGFNHLGFRPAVDGTIVNSGVIDSEGDGSAGVVMVGDGHRLVNSGRITTDGGAFDSETVGPFRAAGVVVVGDDGVVENSASIRSKDAASAAVELNVVEQEGVPAAGLSSQLTNSGLISAPDVAVLGGAGQETVVNRGRIVGDVSGRRQRHVHVRARRLRQRRGRARLRRRSRTRREWFCNQPRRRLHGR